MVTFEIRRNNYFIDIRETMAKVAKVFVNDTPTVNDQSGCKFFCGSNDAFEFVWKLNIVLVAKTNKIATRQTCHFQKIAAII